MENANSSTYLQSIVETIGTNINEYWHTLFYTFIGEQEQTVRRSNEIELVNGFQKPYRIQMYRTDSKNFVFIFSIPFSLLSFRKMISHFLFLSLFLLFSLIFSILVCLSVCISLTLSLSLSHTHTHIHTHTHNLTHTHTPYLS